MKRYKYTKLRNLGSVHGFLIHTPDDRKLLDIYPIGIVRELNRMADYIARLEQLGDALAVCADDNPYHANHVTRWSKNKDSKP